MSCVQTKYFGLLEYREDAVFEFPGGLPAFENEQRFVLIESPRYGPLVFLQSLETSSLCFLALPIQVLDRNYRLAMGSEDLKTLGLDSKRQPELGNEVVVLGLVSVQEDEPATANLMAPLVMNLKNRRALQAIREDSLYSHQHPIEQRGMEGGAC